MNALFLLIFILGGALTIGRGLDLALWTDWETGLCLTGSVWLRYAALAIAVAAALWVGFRFSHQPSALRTRYVPFGRTSALAGAFFALAGVLRLVTGLTGIGAIIRAVLEIVCGLWFAGLAKSWLRKGDYQVPTRSMTPAVLGTAVFYWCVLGRFMENSSSWHRAEPTAMIWQMLAALLFLSALLRALWLPETSNGRMLCMAGLASFMLCFCWGLPHALVMVFRGLTAADLPELFYEAGLCCVGALGLFCTAGVAGSKKGSPDDKHSVG